MKPQKTFGTFPGVFTPTTLTILGVIMFIRHPWVVGNAGVLGALAIVLLSVTITLTTALSLSSITTNMRIGNGGAFSLIYQSLGLEIGGAIGIPFYFAQAVAVAMYVFGFREGLLTMVPALNPFFMDVGIFAIVMGIAFVSTQFAFRIQYVILGIIFLSIVSIFSSLFVNELHTDIEWFGTYPGSPENNFEGSSFWEVFAVFFPAVTGVMAGANMSGDLTNPRKSIPKGTISSVIITAVIYILLVIVAALIASPAELTHNYNLFIEKALFGPIVLAGLLGATLSSALGSFVGAPRILLALGEKRILPKSEFLAKTSKKGEPQNAMLVTAVIVLVGISLRNLNTIAPLLTMFFMITYAMINVVALIEQTLGLPSFRPTLKIPIWVPAIGTFGSIAIMFVMNVVVAVISIILIVLFYFYLVRVNAKAKSEEERNGLLTALKERFTKKTEESRSHKTLRLWRPDLLVPVSDPKEIQSAYKLILSIIQPKGSIKLLGLINENPSMKHSLPRILVNTAKKLQDRKLPVSYTVIDNPDYNETVNKSMLSPNGQYFDSNLIFASIDTASSNLPRFDRLLLDARKNSYGMLLFIPYETVGLGTAHSINLWLTKIPNNWKTIFDVGENDLATLLAILISRNWKGLIQVKILENLNEPSFSADDIEDLRAMVRFPKETTIQVLENEFSAYVVDMQAADLNIFSIQDDMGLAQMVSLVEESKVSGLFCADSQHENVLV